MLLERLVHGTQAGAGADDGHVARDQKRPHGLTSMTSPRLTERPASEHDVVAPGLFFSPLVVFVVAADRELPAAVAQPHS
jgi:hypothetical protein